MKVREGGYYWLDAPAYDPEEPLKVGEYLTSGKVGKWRIDGEFITAGSGIDVIKEIKQPRRGRNGDWVS